MAFTMEITDGSTTIDILQTNDATVGYHLQTESYTPQINRRNPSDFGAVYLPVLESFNIAIVGSSANDVHVKLAALVNLMDNVRLWFDSDAAAADAVTFVFKPSSSTESAEYQALIVSDAEIGYSQYIEHVGNWYRMPDVRVSFMRNEWLGEEETATQQTPASTSQPAVLHTQFASSSALPSPVDIHLASSFGTSSIESTRVTLVSSVDIEYLEAELGTLGTGIASHADSSASGSATAKVTPTNTNPKTITFAYPSASNIFPYKKFSIWATVRNNSAGTPINYTVNAALNGSGVSPPIITQSYNTVVESGSIYCRVVNLGNFSFIETFADSIDWDFVLTITPDATDGSGASDLEIDAIAIVDTSTDGDGYFMSVGNTTGFYGTNGGVLTKPSGYCFNGKFSPSTLPIAYFGDARQRTIGDDIYTFTFDVMNEFTISGWKAQGSGAQLYYGITATRRLASLTPL